MEKAWYATPFGGLTLVFAADGALQALELGGDAIDAPHPVPPEWQARLDAYFSGSLLDFHHPISANGTPYQQSVWTQIAAIPAGEVRTYQEIADVIDSHPRAVGMACGKNPLALVVPCHRVVAKAGLGGFSSGGGQALMIKQWLLQHEGAQW